MELKRYRTTAGRVPFSEWHANLDSVTAGRIAAYVDRMKSGHFGDSRSVGHGISELRINFGPGYRVYYIRDGQTIIVLLCAGHKRSQDDDIREAHTYAEDYWRRQ